MIVNVNSLYFIMEINNVHKNRCLFVCLKYSIEIQ